MNNDKGKITVSYYGKEISMEFSNDATTDEMVDEVVEPLLIAMGYSPINVYEATNNVEMLDVLKEHDYDR